MVAPTPQNPTTTQLATEQPTSGADEAWLLFAQQQLASLGLDIVADGTGWAIVDQAEAADLLEEPPTKSSAWRRLKGLGRREADTPESPSEYLSSSNPSELLDWLAKQLASENQIVQVEPIGEPKAVHEIVSSMFDAYTVDEGAVHLGGCHLEYTPLLRMTTVNDGTQLKHQFFDSAGVPLAEELVEQLKLDETNTLREARPRVERSDWQPAIDSATPHTQATSLMPMASIVVVKRARGHLEATLGEASVAIPFDDWARTLSAPPVTCPHSGAETFHLTALADGRLAAAEQTVLCEHSEQRILKSESIECSGTGKRVAAELCQPCPATGDLVLAEGLADCPRCGQSVSRGALTARGCRGCDPLPRVDSGDPRLEIIRTAAPKLASQKNWRLAESEQLLVAETASWFSRTLLVVDKATQTVHRAATASRWGQTWRPLTEDEIKLLA